MAKRKLTRQQAWRIEKIQAERAERARRRDAAAEQALSAGQLGEEQQGRVIAHYGTQVAVESSAGTSHRCHI
ncbi:MAG: ribosome biogenesis GTPase RsgA, partial [Halioglobus sp.]